jgi:hypothetical protein
MREVIAEIKKGSHAYGRAAAQLEDEISTEHSSVRERQGLE